MIHIHSPPAVIRRKSRRHCPTCGKRTTFVGWFYEWYGWSITCLSCGDKWNDGFREARPFARGWRQQNIAAAKRRWKETITLEPTHDDA